MCIGCAVAKLVRGEALPEAWPIARDAKLIVAEHEKRYGEKIVTEAAKVPAVAGTGKRHLLFHVWPLNNGAWRRHADELRRRVGVFNGVRAGAIVTDENCDSAEQVKAAFSGVIDEWEVLPNEPGLGETVSFLPLWRKVAPFVSPDDMTFYCHGKGVRFPMNGSVWLWTQVMYELGLDYLPLAEELLQTHSLVGAIKKVGFAFMGSRSSWHYSGTFFWFKNRDAFSVDWSIIDQMYGGIEAWPGLHFPHDKGAALLCETGELNLYDFKHWHKLYVDLQNFRGRHEAKRTVYEGVHQQLQPA